MFVQKWMQILQRAQENLFLISTGAYSLVLHETPAAKPILFFFYEN